MIPVVAAGRVLWTAARAGCAAAAHPLARGAATGLPEGAWTRASPSWPGCSGGRRVRGERRHEPVQHGVDLALAHVVEQRIVKIGVGLACLLYTSPSPR